MNINNNLVAKLTLYPFLLGGCGPSMYTSWVTLDYNYTSKHKKAEEIEVYFGTAQPDKPYSVIAIIQVLPNRDYWTTKGEPKLDDYICEIKKEAAKKGADAVIGINPPMEFDSTSVDINLGEVKLSTQDFAISGQAVIYQK